MELLAMLEMYEMLHPEDEIDDENGGFWDNLVWCNNQALHLSPNLVI